MCWHKDTNSIWTESVLKKEMKDVKENVALRQEILINAPNKQKIMAPNLFKFPHITVNRVFS